MSTTLWYFTQKWDGLKAYSFVAQIDSSGVVTIPGGFSGVIEENPGNVSIAVANYSQQSAAAYLGTNGGHFMGGTVKGTAKGTTTPGVWFAVLAEPSEIDKREHQIPG